MESQDEAVTVIPCSAEMEEAENNSLTMPPPTADSSDMQNSDDHSQSQSLLADLHENTTNEENISNINSSEVNKTAVMNASSSERNSVSNSVMELESSEINPMSSTRIEQDNSMSMLNEGFMIDSASLSLSAVNEDSRVGLGAKQTMAQKETNDTISEEEVESTEIELDDEVIEDESMEVEDHSKSLEQVDSEEEDDSSDDYPRPQFPLNRVKRIMVACAVAEDDESHQEIDQPNKSKKKEKGKGNIIITKEAIYLTTLATEHFISVIGKMAGDVAVSSKKKTLTMEHLKRALSDADAFAFLEGCFQPSLIIGD